MRSGFQYFLFFYKPFVPYLGKVMMNFLKVAETMVKFHSSGTVFVSVITLKINGNTNVW